MNAELTLLRHLLATCRAVRRCNPDIETSKAALNEERRLQDRIEKLQQRVGSVAPAGVPNAA